MKFLLFAAGSVLCFILFQRMRKQQKAAEGATPENVEEASSPTVSVGFPLAWRSTLQQKVLFYNSLTADEKTVFEERLQHFLNTTTVTGVNATVTDEDRVLIGASAVVPIFGFPDWEYANIDEVLLYPDAFTKEFDQVGYHRSVLGMVGNGFMNGKMILSQKALHLGFDNTSDKNNTALHEFVHLIDKSDGVIDGIPDAFLDKQYVLPWVDLMEKMVEEIAEGETGINPYGATNTQEFLAVVSEYFFERPKLLKKKHPEVYRFMELMFRQDMAARSLEKVKHRTGRNDPCPCGSGKKFKQCHLPMAKA